jgi:hypothetical protein
MIARELNTVCSENNIKIKANWIPREQNKIADGLGQYSDCDNWGIDESVFQILDQLWDDLKVRFLTAIFYNACNVLIVCVLSFKP